MLNIPENDQDQKFYLISSRKNVSLTEIQIQQLKKLFKDDFLICIEKFSSYLADSGKRYKSHYRAIRNWVPDWLHNQKCDVTYKSKLKEQKAETKETAQSLLTKFAHLLVDHSNDPVVVNGIKILDFAFVDRSKGVSINFKLCRKEILELIAANYDLKRDYIRQFIQDHKK